MHLSLFRSLSITTPRALACAFAFVFSSAAGIAAVVTTDDFNDNAINPLLWQTNESESLVETNQRLEFSPSSVSGGQWYLTSKLTLPTDQNWTVQIDVAHLAATTEFSFIGLALFSQSGDSLHYLISRPGQLSASDPELSAYFTTDGSYTDTFGTSLGSIGVLRIEKSGNTFSLLRGTYSAITGYSFSSFRSYDFEGVGGGNASADWNTQPGETFTLRLTASATNEQIASGLMTFDNFRAETPTSPVPEPATAGAVAGAFALGLAVFRRRVSRRSLPAPAVTQ